MPNDRALRWYSHHRLAFLYGFHSCDYIPSRFGLAYFNILWELNQFLHILSWLSLFPGHHDGEICLYASGVPSFAMLWTPLPIWGNFEWHCYKEWGEMTLQGWRCGGARPHSTRVFAFETAPHGFLSQSCPWRDRSDGNSWHCPLLLIFSIVSVLQCSQSGGHASVSHGLNFTSLTSNTIFPCLLGICISPSMMCLPNILPSVLLRDLPLVFRSYLYMLTIR